ncbi:hypothetical protein [Streptomyces sp. NPDC058308]|uniref:hypothetical protein n=1 Tax=Streptomyces sp. NPDC058308 TaxID=3346440 RepID=UPI0036EA2600
MAEFEQARALRPGASGPLHWLGCAAAHRGDLAAAEQHLSASLACAVPHSRSLVQRSYVRARAGDREAALSDLRAAALIGPLDDEAHWVLAALSGRPAREVALRLRRAAVSALSASAEPADDRQPGQRAAEGWQRAGELIEAARGVEGGQGIEGGDGGDATREDAPAQDNYTAPQPGPQQPYDATRAARPSPGADNAPPVEVTRKAAVPSSGASTAPPVGVTRKADRPSPGANTAPPVEVPRKDHPQAWAFAPLYAVALLRSGRRAVAVSLLGDAVRHDPSDHRVTHTLALALLNSPAEQRGSGWERCVAAWAALLHDARFWGRVLGSAARRYDVAVEPALAPALRAGLREVLERRMPGDDDAGTRVAPGPLLQREADAAKLLAAVGGFPSAGGGGAPLVCGPLRVAELGRTAEFGAFAAVQDAASSYPSLTYAFSELGFAQILLGQDKAADALAALSELRCSDCRARGGPGTGAVCEPGCARFDELNPGYAGLPDKHRRLALDARGLALEARLSMGRNEMTAVRPDYRAAGAYWRRALVHSRELDRYRETQAAIVDMALGAARAAHREGRLSLAVATLDATRSVIGANERGRLEGQLARVLADRGISVANDKETPLDQPAADLRRSVAFNPHLLRTQVSLGIVLRGLAAARWSSGSLSGARATLREAIDQLTAALAHFPDDPDLEEQREAAVADLDHVMWQSDESEQ